MRKTYTMLLKKTHLLKKINKLSKKLDSALSNKIESKYEDRLKNLEVLINNLQKDNQIKNTKIDDLNKKVAFYESETKNLTNDVVTLTNVVRDVYTLVELILMQVDPDFAYKILEEINRKGKKKKVYH